MFLELGRYALTFGSSLFDVWSDVVNSLTFLGYHQSASIGNGFNTNTSNENLEQCHEMVNGTTCSVHKMWGGISMSLIFIIFPFFSPAMMFTVKISIMLSNI